jgi:hypothetical protein
MTEGGLAETIRGGMRDAADETLALAILGTTNPATIAADVSAFWRGTELPPIDECIGFELSVGGCFHLRLADGTRAFLKAHPRATLVYELRAQHQVQARLHELGYPAPDVRSPPRAGERWVGVVMEYRQDGALGDAHEPLLRKAMAHALAELVRLATREGPFGGLPDRRGKDAKQLYATPHNALFDFASTGSGAEWIDAAAEGALEGMNARAGRRVVGHNDWSAKNLRFSDDDVAIVYDWDAMFTGDETGFVANAAVHFPVNYALARPELASPLMAATFVDEYEQARAEPFTPDERARIYDAMVHSVAYTARCEHALQPGSDAQHGSARALLKALPEERARVVRD